MGVQPLGKHGKVIYDDDMVTGRSPYLFIVASA